MSPPKAMRSDEKADVRETVGGDIAVSYGGLDSFLSPEAAIRHGEELIRVGKQALERAS